MTALQEILPDDAGFAVTQQAFETAVLGAPVCRLDIESAAFLDPDALALLTRRARGQGVALMSARVPENASLAQPLAAAGFRAIERLLTLRRDIPAKLVPVSGVAPARMDDAEACAAIGRESFFFDRFHADPNVSKSVADEIKARWARNGVNGRADAPLVVREECELAGFSLCMRKGGDAVIDLIAVDRRRRGKGLGRKLVEGAIAHYAGVAPAMWVSTQESNVASLALYRGTGFVLQSVAETWHWTP
jgi:ribosomal protein S18 acetylase RimI-like enzyme